MLTIYQFGEELIRTEDLDPVYVALWEAHLDDRQLARLLIAYACFYHLGVAAQLSEYRGEKYWDKLYDVAENAKLEWPRNSERRHFRGKFAVETVRRMRADWKTPEDLFSYWVGTGPLTFKELSARVQSIYGFGTWVAFKIADLLERLSWPVSFKDCELGIYKDPKQGAALHYFGDYNHDITTYELKIVIEELTGFYNKTKAPPRYERPCGVQEIETILCRYKTYYKGHYWLGEDTQKIKHDLLNYGKTAGLLLKNMPKGLTYEESKKIGGVPVRV